MTNRNENIENENRLAHLAELIDEKKSIDQQKKQKEKEILSSATSEYSEMTGKDISSEDIDKINILTKEKKKGEKNFFASLKKEEKLADEHINMFVRKCLDFMIQENGTYKTSFHGLGSIKYDPGIPYLFDASIVDKIDVLSRIFEMGAWDCLQLDEEKYLQLNQQYVEEQKKKRIPEDEIQYLPGILDKGDLVLPGEVKVTLSRKK